MQAITIPQYGDPEVLLWTDMPDPVPRRGEVLIEVAAAGLNRADIAQRQGKYPPPPGASALPGLEVAGRVAALGPGVTGWSVGEEVCALLAGGGYAQKVAVPAGQVLPVPQGVSLLEAAALPEATCTVWSNVVQIAQLRAGQTLLVHGGSSGIGTMAIQLGKALGARVVVTAGSPEKLEACRQLGADVAVNYREQDFVQQVGPQGADVILDVIGAQYLDRNVDALSLNGRMVVIGLQGGSTAPINLGKLLVKRAAVVGSTLRARPVEEKAEVVAAVREHVWPLLESGRVRPVVDRVFPFEEAAEAHRLMESSSHIGKILLQA
ncbi:NAD(P)H-quinone oxidoreductase [Streptomyces sp. NPDC059070]|uniref:NAD(P)H-quinone oxidoreductase n=1 Tax=unclassified Streptomyces TaxID=2593676 RepID=UPI0034E2FEBF